MKGEVRCIWICVDENVPATTHKKIICVCVDEHVPPTKHIGFIQATVQVLYLWRNLNWMQVGEHLSMYTSEIWRMDTPFFMVSKCKTPRKKIMNRRFFLGMRWKYIHIYYSRKTKKMELSKKNIWEKNMHPKSSTHLVRTGVSTPKHLLRKPVKGSFHTPPNGSGIFWVGMAWWKTGRGADRIWRNSAGRRLCLGK